MLNSRRRVVKSIVATAASPSVALACDCSPSEVGQITDWATTIAIGTLIGGGRKRTDQFGLDEAYESARWRVAHTWKGSIRTGAEFVTVSLQGSCGVAFNKHRDWLLFLPEEPPVRPSVSNCTPIFPLESAADHVKYLNNRFKSAPWLGRAA